MSEKTEVLFNETCPICSREVAQYEKMTTKAELPITYHGISNPNTLADWRISPEDAARRFHVRKDGVTYGGVPAFLVLWEDIPQMRWLARLIRTPGIFWSACKVYDYVLAPVLYRLHVRRQAQD
ncbi:MAG: DCC1-like thiol-disulfide oxidoreductase family protein [Pseudomonadota bacterium]